MRFIKPGINIDFIGKRKIAYIISIILILISIITLVIHRGPRLGIDFAGGTLIQIKFESPVAVDSLNSALATLGISGTIQTFGERNDNEYLIRTDLAEHVEKDLENKIVRMVQESTGVQAEIRRIEMVGPQVGKDLRDSAMFAIFFALLFITVYISGRFELKWTISGIMAAALMGSVYLLSLFAVSMAFLITAALVITLILFWFLELKYAMGAIAALIHDVMITVGMFSILGVELSLPIVAAILLIIGYSLNDTIIVFDRIRENKQKYPKNPMDATINRSINQTLSRTLLTSGTTLTVVAVLFAFGGDIIHDFALAILVGVAVGTFSSIYVASPILLAWQTKQQP